MKWLALTALDGNEIWINFNDVRYYVRNTDGGTLIRLADSLKVGVKEKPEEIMTRLS